MHEKTQDDARSVVRWLTMVCVLIILTVVVGGITRLTESGLSIVEWKPVTGILPPMQEQAWLEAFLDYQEHQEYQMLKPDMTMKEFKAIYFWEYLHRMLARSIGLVYLVPFIVFLKRRKISRALKQKLWIGFALGGLQGFLGWFMVKSGLSDVPYVSHFRLAAHLCLALFVLSYLAWIIMSLKPVPSDLPAQPGARKALYPLSIVTLFLDALQIVYGAFVAGLNAGYMLNTWPKVMGKWIPDGMGSMKPFALDLLSNGTTVQFIHRWLAFLVLALVTALAVRAVRCGAHLRLAKRLAQLVVLTIFQVIIGILTLVFVTPVVFGAFHQFTACLVLLASVAAVYESRRYRVTR